MAGVDRYQKDFKSLVCSISLLCKLTVLLGRNESPCRPYECFSERESDVENAHHAHGVDSFVGERPLKLGSNWNKRTDGVDLQWDVLYGRTPCHRRCFTSNDLRLTLDKTGTGKSDVGLVRKVEQRQNWNKQDLWWLQLEQQMSQNQHLTTTRLYQ